MSMGKYTARFTTAGRLTKLENWLSQNAKGAWSFKLEDVSEDMAKKNYVVIFNDKADRDLFRQRFSLKKTAEHETQPAPHTEEQSADKASAQAEAPSRVAVVAADALKATSGLFDSMAGFSTKLHAAVKKRLDTPAHTPAAPVKAPESAVSVTRSN